MIEHVLTLSRIHDVFQRGVALAERLIELDDARIIETIKALAVGVGQGSEEHTLLYNALARSKTLASKLGRQRLARLVFLAQKMNCFEAVTILVDLTNANENRYHQPFLDSALKETPLGVRKSLARKLDFRMIQRIARDQDHRVIHVLLDNPRLIESDVIRIGATRPNSPKVLLEIANHRRWITRHAVKKTIILNPYSPLSVALRLLIYMSFDDLDEITACPDLNNLLIQEAEKLYKLRSGGSGEAVYDLSDC